MDLEEIKKWRDERVKGFLKYELNWLEKYIDDLIVEVERLQHQHKDMVLRNACLRDRPDLPLERTNGYERTVRETANRCAEICESDLLFGDIDTCAECAEAIRKEFGV